MPNEDNTQQMSNSNSQLIAQLVAAVRSLEDRVIGLEPRLANVEEIIVARLNDTRPLEQQILAQLNELIAGQSRVQEQMARVQEQMARMQEQMARVQEQMARVQEQMARMQEQMARMQEQMARMQEQMDAMREELTALREDFERFRRETNDNFRLVNNKLDVLNQDVLTVRAQQRDLEKRVTRLEQEPIESAA